MNKKELSDRSKPEQLHPESSVLGISLLILSIFVADVSLFYHVPIHQTFGFIIGGFFFLYLPGLFILDVLGWRDNIYSLSILAILIGIAASPILYYSASSVGQQWIYLVAIFFMSVCALYKNRYSRLAFSLRVPDGTWMVLIVLFILLAVLHFSHFTDLVILGDGGYRLRTTRFTESIFHMGIINAMEHSIPPDYPYASGFTLSEYHMDMHILSLIFCKYMGINSMIMTYFFTPFLLMGMVMAVPAVLFYAIKDDLPIALFLSVLMLGSDFSFITAMWKNWPDTYPWTLTFTSTIWSMFTFNGIMAAIPLLFGAVLAYQRFHSSKDIRNLAVFSLLTISAFRMKSSMGLHIAGAAFMSLAFLEWKYRAGLWRKTVPILSLTFFIIFIDALMKSHSADNVIIKWNMLSGFAASSVNLGMDFWQKAVLMPSKHPIVLLLGVTLYFIGFMGVRIIFLRYCYELMKKGKKYKEAVPFLLIFIISGIVLSELIYIGGYDSKNNAGWFKVQSIIAASFFVAYFISSLRTSTSKITAMVIVVLLSFPTTINFLRLRYDSQYCDITKNHLLGVEFIKKAVPGDSIILEYPRYNGPSLSSNLAGRKTVLTYFRSFLDAKVDPHIIEERTNNLMTFFSADDEQNRMMIVLQYNVDYLVVPSRIQLLQAQLSHYSWVKEVYSNPDVTIYKIDDKFKKFRA